MNSDTRAVSPVVATILMVAVVVVLTGATGGYLFQLTDSVDDAPNTAFSAEYDTSTRDNVGTSPDGHYLNVTHTAGDTLQTGALNISVTGAWSRDTDDPNDNEPAVYVGPNPFASQAGSDFTAAETVSINSSSFREAGGAAIDNSDYLDLQDATVRIVWQSSSTDDSVTLWTWEF
ncbi:type IV pilin [Halogeometricum limi]|uniref:Flagellin N-terminal-like domain-containing protein n=1 Tax=Halogeometricum limi TaxID=555875 RepID=A0A1I6GMF0_9EURY|nr:type IV pilin N-terminal domain-containing protein [Halogeometricum limi]SFR43364.1 flagellin N-terminal-like domain-containing protein [Halogeometricum limi]